MRQSEKSYKFLSFTERLKSSRIDVAKCRKSGPSVNGSFFVGALEYWKETNLSGEFVALTRTLKRRPKVECLCEALQTATGLGVEPLLDLTIALALDLKEDFIAHVPQFLGNMFTLLSSQEADVIESVFQCITGLIKYLGKYLAEIAISVYQTILPFLSSPKCYNSRFAAESFSYLLRKVSNPADLVAYIYSSITDSNSEAHTVLFYSAVAHVGHSLHSCTPILLPCLVKYCQSGVCTAVLRSAVDQMVKSAEGSSRSDLVEILIGLFKDHPNVVSPLLIEAFKHTQDKLDVLVPQLIQSNTTESSVDLLAYICKKRSLSEVTMRLNQHVVRFHRKLLELNCPNYESYFLHLTRYLTPLDETLEVLAMASVKIEFGTALESIHSDLLSLLNCDDSTVIMAISILSKCNVSSPLFAETFNRLVDSKSFYVAGHILNSVPLEYDDLNLLMVEIPECSGFVSSLVNVLIKSKRNDWVDRILPLVNSFDRRIRHSALLYLSSVFPKSEVLLLCCKLESIDATLATVREKGIVMHNLGFRAQSDLDIVCRIAVANLSVCFEPLFKYTKDLIQLLSKTCPTALWPHLHALLVKCSKPDTTFLPFNGSEFANTLLTYQGNRINHDATMLTALKALVGCKISEENTNSLVAMFLESSELSRDVLREYLRIFANFPLRTIHESDLLLTTLLEIFERTSDSIAVLVLNCIEKYKFEWYTPYHEIIVGILDGSYDYMNLSLSDDPTFAPQHMENIVPLVLKVMRKKFGKFKASILQFLGRSPPEYTVLFFKLLVPFIPENLEHADLLTDYTPKTADSFIQTSQVFIKRLGVKIECVHEDMLRILLLLTACATKSDNALRRQGVSALVSLWNLGFPCNPQHITFSMQYIVAPKLNAPVRGGVPANLTLLNCFARLFINEVQWTPLVSYLVLFLENEATNQLALDTLCLLQEHDLELFRPVAKTLLEKLAVDHSPQFVKLCVDIHIFSDSLPVSALMQIINSKAKPEIKSTIAQILSKVVSMESYVALCPLFEEFGTNGRVQLAISVTELASQLDIDVSILLDMNCRRMIDDIDIERLLHSFVTIHQQNFTMLQWTPILYSCFYYLAHSEAAVRRTACECICKFIETKFPLEIVTKALRRGIARRVTQQGYFKILWKCVECIDTEPYDNLKQFLPTPDTADMSVFETMFHIQIHRRQRAMNLLCEAVDNISTANLKAFFLPIVITFLQVPELLQVSLSCLTKISSKLTWNAYSRLLLKFFKSKIHEKTVIKAILAVLEGFSFDLKEVGAMVRDRILPQLYKILFKTKKKDQCPRVSIAVGIARLLENVQPLVTRLAQLLRSHNQYTRNKTRDTLAKVATIAGPNSLVYFVKDLKLALTRGPQLHVLGYTLHSILTSIKPTKIALDHCSKDICDIVFDDLFGVVADEKAAEFVKKMTELKRSKSMETAEIACRHGSMMLLNHVVKNIQQLADSTERVILDKLDVLVKRVATGILENTIDAQEKFKLAVNLAEDTRCPLITLGLDIFLGLLTQGVEFDKEHVESFAVTVGDCFMSKHTRVVVTSARILGRLSRTYNIAMTVRIVMQNALLLLTRDGNPKSSISQSILKFVLNVLRHCEYYEMPDDRANALVMLLKPELGDCTHQTVYFAIIKNLVKRRASNALDLVSDLQRIMVTNTFENIRDISKSIYIHILMDCPLEETQLQDRFSWIIKNLAFEHEYGRKSVLDLCRSLCKKLPNEILAKFSEILLLALASRLSDESACRTIAENSIIILLSRIQVPRLAKIVHLFYSNEKTNLVAVLLHTILLKLEMSNRLLDSCLTNLFTLQIQDNVAECALTALLLLPKVEFSVFRSYLLHSKENVKQQAFILLYNLLKSNNMNELEMNDATEICLESISDNNAIIDNIVLLGKSQRLVPRLARKFKKSNELKRVILRIFDNLFDTSNVSDMLSCLYMMIMDTSNNTEEWITLREQAEQLIERARESLGTAEFTLLYANVRSEAERKKLKRKQEMADLAVTDPQRHAIKMQHKKAKRK